MLQHPTAYKAETSRRACLSTGLAWRAVLLHPTAYKAETSRRACLSTGLAWRADRQQQLDEQQALEGCSLLINSRSRVCSEERSQRVAGVINR